ncbi:hypothetical protein RND81_14G123500 [Saponaria officinalis]|uniref:Box C/D snoRNA protein 1 n=1 Tax=Saponaria officinalis TaxID=3572 RepID=A0AAW1GKY0_SAPOF
MNYKEVCDDNTTKNNVNLLCEECKIEKFKYKCPGCARRTCSLICVNSHKKNYDCSGKRDPTAFVPLSKFDDSTLISDYNLLEDVKRVAESSQRMRMQLCTYYQYRLPIHLKALQGAASRRRTTLHFFPSGMSKRQKNQTRFMSRAKTIKWTIEWQFHSTDIALLEHMVHENSTLRSIIEKHLQPSPWRNKLRRFTEVPVDNLKFFIRKNQEQTNSPYRELDLDTPLRQLFSGLVILEYPVIHAFLPSDPCNFEVIKDVRPTRTGLKSKEPITDVTLNPIVLCSKEEEIVEDEAPEPKILDFLDPPTKEPTKSTPTVELAPEVEKGSASTEVEMLERSIEEFDFDQELRDVYSMLLERGNPDDFLSYDPEGEKGDHLNTDVYFADVEELEEGEIPSAE